MLHVSKLVKNSERKLCFANQQEMKERDSFSNSHVQWHGYDLRTFPAVTFGAGNIDWSKFTMI